VRKILYVGDPHATPDELDDCTALMGLVERVAREEQVDETCILGDLHHTFDVIRCAVMAFWMQHVRGKRLIVGNHDFSGEGSDIHALLAYQDRALIVDRPVMSDGILYMPYFSDRKKFVEVAQHFGPQTNTVVCHQTFAGSKYENGFYANEEDAVNPDLIPQERIISGHIHAPQEFGKVTYLGSPRWRALNDANSERAIWVYTFDDDGHVVAKKSFDTGSVCRQIRYVIDTPDQPFDGEMDSKHDWRIDVHGPQAFVEERQKKFTRPGVKVRAFPDRTSKIVVRESEGVAKAFSSYLAKYTPKHGTASDILGGMARERLGL
jgi:hypothetical protein